MPSRDEDAGEGTAEAAATYVVPERWRAGIGSELLGAALSRLREAGFHEATLWVFAGNHGARAFYGTLGFEPDGAEVTHDWAAGEAAVRLRASLT